MELNAQQLEQLKEKALAILTDFDRVCQELGLAYSLSSGTALGAVRHQGFIPWDDDIDVMMPREDYQKFEKFGQSRLKQNYVFQTFHTDHNYPLPFGKIRDTNTVLVENAIQTIETLGGIYIDIFPVDRVAPTKLGRKLDNLYRTLLSAVKYSYTREWANASVSKARRLVRLMLYPLSRCLGTRVLTQMEEHNRMKNNAKGGNMTYADRYCTPPNRITEDMLIPMRIFEEYTKLPFENHSFPCVKEYDAYLTRLYGDYMKLPPEHERAPHHDVVQIQFEKE